MICPGKEIVIFMKKRINSSIFAVLIALIMVFSLMPQLPSGESEAAEKAKLTIEYRGGTYRITESQWDKLYKEKAEKHYYSSREKANADFDGYEYKEYEGVKLTDVLETAGIDVSGISSTSMMNFRSSDGYSQKIKAETLLKKQLYAFSSVVQSETADTAPAEPQQVPAMISDTESGRLVFGQNEEDDFNKFHWVKSLYGSTLTIEASGSEDDPYLISTVQDMVDFADKINRGNNADKYYKLTADIDLGGMDWTPVGMLVKPFRGIFDGNGKKITGLNVSDSGDFLGLFGYNLGTIKNLTVSGCVTNTSTSKSEEHGDADFIGGVAGFNAGTMIDVDSNVVVDASGANNVGGIAGFNTSGKWVDSRDVGDEEGIKKTIAGAEGIIQRCGNAGFVAGRMKVGGIVGENAGTVEKCYNKGTVVNMKTFGGSGVGGIAGRNGNNNTAYEVGIISKCYNAGTVVLDCYNTGKEKAKDGNIIKTGRWAGGISGWVNDLSSIEDSYVCGKLDVEYAYGDWAPLYARSDGGEMITNCYTIEGLDMSLSSKVKNPVMHTGIIKSSSYMKSTDFVSELGGSFAKDNGNLNSGYPVLSWQNADRNIAVTGAKVDIGKVSGLKADTYGTSYLTLTWDKVADAEEYRIQKYSSGSYKTVKTLSGSAAATYKVSGLTSGSGYRFRVVASRTKYDITAKSYSNALYAPVKPGKVTLSRLRTGSSHYITASWKKKTGTGYQVRLATNSKFTSGVKTYKVTSYKTLSKKMTKLKKGRTYYVKVRAYKTYGGRTVYGSYSSYKKLKCR